MNLRNHKDWDSRNGLLSVSMEPHLHTGDSQLYVLLNGNSGNFCLDYNNEDYNKEIALQRAWSSDTGYYVKILQNDTVKVTRWWDGHEEELPYRKVTEKPELFYKAITKQHAPTGSIISFAKETFIKLRNCVQQSDNGQESLRLFMHLLAALEDDVQTPQEVDTQKWHLNTIQDNSITSLDWEFLYLAFQKGGNSNSGHIKPLVNLVLRHASNRLFQEAHREATRKSFQFALFGGGDRKYNSGVSDGAYYTPTPLVRTIVQEALWALDKEIPLAQRNSLRILDPACGSAEFLRESLRQLKMRDYSGSITIVGWDISAIACEMAKFVLHYESRSEWNSAISIDIVERDSLNYDWTNETPFDIVLMNPPFTAFENLKANKNFVQDKLKGYTQKQPDAAALFWKNAAEIVAPHGTLGLILPHSFLNAATYSSLRNYLTKDVNMHFSLIGRLGSAGLFEKAMIIPCILVGIKKEKAIANTVLWTDYQPASTYEALRELRKYRLADIPTPIATPAYSIYENEYLTDSAIGHNWTVRSYSTFELVEKLKDFNKVSNFFDVSRGAESGNNSAFLLKKSAWESLPKNERLYFRPCIMRDTIQQGKLNDGFYLFYPYGKYVIQSEDELKSKLSTYANSILKKEEGKLKEKKGKESKWWELRRPGSFQNKEKDKNPKLVSAHFGRSGYFAYDLTGEYIVGESYVWLPKKEEFSNKTYCFAYLSILNASLIDILLEMVCNTLDGGYFDLSKRYIEQMPLPDLTKVDANTLAYLTNIGEKIHRGDIIDRDKLNQIVANAYGLDLEKFKL